MAFFDNIFGKKDEKEQQKEQKTEQLPKDTASEHTTILPNVATAKDSAVPEANNEASKKADLKDQDDDKKNLKEDQQKNPKSKLASDKDKKASDESGKKDGSEIKLCEMKFKSDNKDKSKLVENVKPEKPKKVSKPIIVKFEDSKGKKIANDFSFTGALGTELKISDLTIIQGFKISSVDKLRRIKITEKEQIIKLTYVPDTVAYSITPVTENQKNIPDVAHKTFHGRVGDKVAATNIPKINGYDFLSARTYKIPKNGGEIKVVYRPKKQNIHVIYQTKSGENLGDEYLTGRTGKTYEIKTDRHNFHGYQLVKNQKDLNGTFNNKTTSITVLYEPIPTSLEVQFLDESGNQVHKPLTYDNGNYKEPYFIKLPTIDGYELTSSPEKLSGIYTHAKENVVLKFQRATVSFNVNFWFDSKHTQSARKPLKVSGIVNDLYETAVPVIDGYTPDRTSIKGRFNTMKNPDQDVVYSRIKTEIKVLLEDETGRLLDLPNGKNPIIAHGLWGDNFDIKLPKVPGYNTPKTNITGKYQDPFEKREIHYSPKEIELTVNYLDAKSNKAIRNYDQESYKYLAGSTYSIDPLNIEGYLLKELPDNATGVVGSKPITVDFKYEPKPATIIFHYQDSTQNMLAKDDKISGYFGQSYDYKHKNFPGFEYVNSTGNLKGNYSAGRLDIYLTFRAKDVSFDLVPTDQFGKAINSYYNQHITGLVNQKFSAQMPEIPGYTLAKHVIKGKIDAEYDGKKFEINYVPKESSVIVHSAIKGGNREGQSPFKDDILSGLVGQGYEVSVKQMPGYHTEKDKISGNFEAEPKDIMVVYNVDHENYEIIFVDPKHKAVGKIDKADGYYGEAVEVDSKVPFGYYLPAGLTDSKVTLNGSKEYKLPVVPKSITIDLVAETQDGDSLERVKEVIGTYKDVQEVTVPIVDGYQPVNGKKIKIDFDLSKGSHQTIPVVYAPEERKVTVRYISLQGESISEPDEFKGHYNEQYTIKAKKIPGYFVIDSSEKKGIYGLKDTDAAFVYRAGSDEYSAATVSLTDILEDQRSQPTDTPDNVVRNDTPEPNIEQNYDNDIVQNNIEIQGNEPISTSSTPSQVSTDDVKTNFNTKFSNVNAQETRVSNAATEQLQSILGKEGYQDIKNSEAPKVHKPVNFLNKVADDAKNAANSKNSNN